MRNAIKIKALIVFAAWMTIFAHNVIPHNHIHENVTGCRELLHKTNPADYDHDGTQKYKSQPEDINVCHISGFLYHQFSQDNFWFENDRDFILNLSNIAEFILHTYKQEFVSDHTIGSTSLRAPPVA